MRTFMLLVICSFNTFGQAGVSAGAITGRVTGPGGQAIAAAKITVELRDRGISRSAETDEDGHYDITALPPGVYECKVEATGFPSHTVPNIAVHVGENVTLDAVFEPDATVDTPVFKVEATGAAPLVETARTQQSSVITRPFIDGLPINQRNFLDFTLLTPGAVSTVSLADGTDFRPPQSLQSGVAIGGGNGRSNTFMVDGAANYGNTGSARPSVSQEAVQEFQINRNTYSAEFGNSTGGAVNIVTREGTNQLHGSVFGYFRERALQARNFFDSTKSPFRRGQYGASLGGPIKRDKTFFFGVYERLDRRETVFVPLQRNASLTALPAAQAQLLNVLGANPALAPLAAGLRGALTPGNYPATLALFRANTGEFPFSETSQQASIRLDHRFHSRHSVFLRGNITKLFTPQTDFGALVAADRGYSRQMLDGTGAIGDTLVISPRWLSETRASFSYNFHRVFPVDRNGPQIDIAGYGLFGRPIYLPSQNIQRHYQFDQVMSWLGGAHSIKFGAQLNPVRDAAGDGLPTTGQFGFGADVPLGALIGSIAGDPNFAAALAAGLPPALGATLAQPITALQSYNLGLPSYYFQGFGDLLWRGWSKRYNFFVQDNYRIRRNLQLSLGARYEWEGKVPQFPADRNNLAPRVGLAWDPWGDGKTTVRAGFGLFFGRIDSHLNYTAQKFAGEGIIVLLVPLSGLPGTRNPLTGQPVTSADIYQRLATTGVLGRRPPAAADLAPLGLVPTANMPLRTTFAVDPDYVNPYSLQSSLEVQRAVGRYSLSAAYSFRRGAHIIRQRDQNIRRAGTTPNGSALIGFADPAVLQHNVYESTANSFYNALTFEVSRPVGGNLVLNAHYTIGRAIDETTDFAPEYQPHDQTNARAERAASAFHRKHRLVAMAVFQSPYRAGTGRGLAHALFGDFSFAPILIANSAQPFNVLTGFDNVGDRHPNTHRPIGAGRNIGIGPNFFTADLRISRRISLGTSEAHSLEFIAEGFNLANRTNFKSVNNVAGDLTLRELPNPIVARRGDGGPLSYTAAQNPCQFQLGARFRF